MISTKIKIAPVTIQAEDLFISVEYGLNTQARFFYSLKTEDGIVIKDGILTLTEEEFASWGTDDTYIEDLVLSKIGFERA